MADPNSSLPNRDTVLTKVRALANISSELEKNSKMLGSATNMVMAGQLKTRVDELQQRQDRLVREIIAWHPDAAVRDEFTALSRKIDDFRPRIKACQNHDELLALQQEMDRTVDEWVFRFQTIVSQLVGAPPPPSAVYQEQKEG